MGTEALPEHPIVITRQMFAKGAEIISDRLEVSHGTAENLLRDKPC